MTRGFCSPRVRVQERRKRLYLQRKLKLTLPRILKPVEKNPLNHSLVSLTDARGIKPDTFAALHTRPLHISTLFPDAALKQAEKGFSVV